MAFQITAKESVRKAVKRVVRKQLDNVLQEMEHGTDYAEVVHAIRQRFKKVRAVLRLVRDELGEKVYRRENGCFRDAARALAELRDTMVLVEALDQLADISAAGSARRALEEVRKLLQADLEAARKHVLDEKAVFAKVRETAVDARARLKDWTISHRGWSAIRPGLRRVYKGSRLAFTAAQTEATTDNLHKLRKQAKYLWHELQLLEPICPSKMKELADPARKLTQLLGDDHDLAVLWERIIADPQKFGDSAAKLLQPLLDRRRRELQAEAFLTAQGLFADKPKPFACRIKEYWKVWRKTADTTAGPCEASESDAGEPSP